MNNPTPPRGASRKCFQSVAYTLLILAVLAVTWQFARSSRNGATPSTPGPAATSSPVAVAPPGPSANPPAAGLDQAPPSPIAGAQPAGVLGRLSALTATLRSGLATGTGSADARLAAQLALADQRASLLSELMARDPAQAIAQSLSFADYAALPVEVQQRVERPFSAKGNFSVFPVCPDGRPQPAGEGADPASATYSAQPEGATGAWPSYVQRRRGGLGSKVGIPLQGFELRGQAVLRDEVMQVLDARNAEAARIAFGMTVANTDPARDFLTGERIVAEPVTAAAGGRLFLFANPANAENLNAELARMERKPGPHTGSQVLFLAFPLEPGEADGGFNLQGAWKAVQLAANAWTETKKKIYIIRVDFSDATGASWSKAEAETLFNFGVSNQLFNMSYGKTWSEATASPMVVRLPGGTNTYRPENNDLLRGNAIATFNALNTGVNLANYDIICVAFKNIGIRLGGVLYSGLGDLGGDSMWLQGNPALYVIVHELGHNYGVGHAHAWATTDGSVVGTGSSQEYGDPFDNMGGGPLPEGYWHMQSKSLLNWLTTSQWTDVTASGNYRVYRIDDRATTPAFSRALRITKAASPAEYYWAGYRRAFTGNRHLSSGAYLLWQQPFDDTCHSLDTTPGSPGGKEDSAILVGRTYSDSVANVHITPIANGGTGADQWLDITVKLGPFPGNQPPTAGALTGPTSWAARTPATYAVTGTDPDGDALAYSWDFGDGVPVASAASLSHSWVVGGNYTVRVTVSDMKGQVVTRTLPVTVSEPMAEWTLRTANPTEDLKDICTGKNGAGTPIVLAVGGRHGFSSLNGSDWTAAPLNEPNGVMQAVTYNGQRFIAAGFEAAESWMAAIWTSVDGVTWARRYTGGADTTIEDVASSGQTAVAVAKAGRILYSTDGGTSWNVATTTATRNFLAVAWGGGTFVAVGANGDGSFPHVYTSTDGIQWTDTSAGAGLAYWQTLESLEYARDRFLSSGFYAQIRHSTDNGASFQTTRTTGEQITGFAYGNGLFLAAGSDAANGDDINLVSADGANWSRLPTAAQNYRNAAVFFKDTFITVGEGGAIWQSPVFLGSDIPPSTTTLAATGVAGTVATLNGSASPNGSATIGFFQWGTTTGYGQTTAAVNVGSGTAAVALSAPLAGLTAGQTYHFRAAASNSFGVTFGSDLTFTTPGGAVAPSATTLAATGVTTSSGTLNGSANPNGSAAIGYFQWGTTTGYGQTTAAVNLGNGTTFVPLSAPLSGLTAGQTYHFRAAASNSMGVVYGSDQTFTTPSAPVAPSATTLAATDLASASATLKGSANPNGSAAIGFFQWGITTDYGQATASVNLGNGMAAVALSTPLAGLTAGQTYHFRAAASNSVGVTFGSDQTFTTPSEPVLPSTTTLPATGVADTGATLNGSANPNGVAAIAYFQWGIDDDYGHTTPVVNLGSGNGEVPLYGPLYGLNPGQTYHFRTVASNSVGVVYGGDLTFTIPSIQVSGPLIMTLMGNNIVIAWPEGVRGILQETPSLSPATWRNSSSGAANPVTLPPTNRVMFYRLAILPSHRWASRVLGYSSAYGTSPLDGWSAAQTLGETNTYPAYGDLGTAWASANPDEPAEFLELGFDSPDPISSVSIYETYNPGAVSKVSVRNPTNGLWVEVWSGPAAPAAAAARIFTVRFPRTSFPVDAIRIDLSSALVPDWNEIDAVSITSNDDFAKRTPISGAPVSVSASSIGASREIGEPYIGGNTGGRSLWWSWTAPSSGSVTFSTVGSDFDTLLGVYTGTEVNALTLVVQNDDTPNGPQAEVTFTATQNVTYQIAVDGFSGTTGAITLSVTRP